MRLDEATLGITGGSLLLAGGVGGVPYFWGTTCYSAIGIARQRDVVGREVLGEL